MGFNYIIFTNKCFNYFVLERRIDNSKLKMHMKERDLSSGHNIQPNNFDIQRLSTLLVWIFSSIYTLHLNYLTIFIIFFKLPIKRIDFFS